VREFVGLFSPDGRAIFSALSRPVQARYVYIDFSYCNFLHTVATPGGSFHPRKSLENAGNRWISHIDRSDGAMPVLGPVALQVYEYRCLVVQFFHTVSAHGG
jgi:hypothetical protein